MEIDPAQFTANPDKTKGNGLYELESMVFRKEDSFGLVTRSNSDGKWLVEIVLFYTVC